MKKHTASDIRVLTLVPHLCKRPKMYTPNGNLSELILFLDGMVFGMRSKDGNDRSHPTAVDALNWLEEKVDKICLSKGRKVFETA